jgi:membrane protein YqaA with SNARE-associated domain
MLDWLVQLVASVAFGVASAVVPLFNGEAYVAGAGVTGVLDPVVAALGVAVGQAVGKVALFWIVRHRPWKLKSRSEPRPLDLGTRLGRFRLRYRHAAKRLLDLVGDARYGLPVTFLAASAGIPPLYAVALLAGASRMRLPAFALTVLAGRALRFGAIALGVTVF